MTGDQLDEVIGGTIGVLAVAVLMRGGQVLVRRLRRPPAANVVLQPPQNMAIGLLVALMAGGFLLYGLFLDASPPTGDGAVVCLVMAIAFILLGGWLFYLGLAWRLVVEKDGLIRIGPFRTQQTGWSEVRRVRVSRNGFVTCELSPRKRFVIVAGCPNMQALVDAAAAAGVAVERA